MAVELQGAAWLAAVEMDDDGRRGWMLGRRTLDRETVRGQQTRQAIGDGAALAGTAGYGDKLPGGIEQTLPIDGLTETFGDGWLGVHDEEL
jgi:hypothetical protein